MNNMWKAIGLWKTINVAILVVAAVGFGMTLNGPSYIGHTIFLIGMMTFLVSSTIESGRHVKETLIAMALTVLGVGVVGYSGF